MCYKKLYLTEGDCGPIFGWFNILYASKDGQFESAGHLDQWALTEFFFMVKSVKKYCIVVKIRDLFIYTVHSIHHSVFT